MTVVFVLANEERRKLRVPAGADDDQALVQIQDRNALGWPRTLAGPESSGLVNLDYVVEAIIESDERPRLDHRRKRTSSPSSAACSVSTNGVDARGSHPADGPDESKGKRWCLVLVRNDR
jgi:hypothetical protein